MYCKNRNFIGVSNLIRLDPNCGVAVLSSDDCKLWVLGDVKQTQLSNICTHGLLRGHIRAVMFLGQQLL